MLVAVRVVVDAGAVLTPIVTVGVVASMPRQLQAWESLEAGWRMSFVLARLGQLTADDEEIATVRFRAGIVTAFVVKSRVVVEVLVDVTTTSVKAVLVAIERISVVVVLLCDI
jgi:hypothetical protein